jgi:co-chaperonin GroES (HSP10)
MSTLPGKLFANLVAVEVNEPKGPVLLPDWKRSLPGTVFAIGPSVRVVSEGDLVYFGAAKGMDAVYDGKNIRIMKEDDIDFVYLDIYLCEDHGGCASPEDYCANCEMEE